MLYTEEFLKQLDEYRDRTVYIKIVALDINERPLEQIEGKATGGSISVDGSSCMRRTFNLTLVAENVNINNYYWGLHTKIRLYVGLENKVAPKYYDKIIWFNEGTYIITSFSTSYATNSYTININGKDKMCLLNGEVGGSINATTDFGQYDEYDAAGNHYIRHYPIKDIIRDSVHEYGHEPFHNIIIKDVDDLGLELLEYRYGKASNLEEDAMYIIRKANSDIYENFTIKGPKFKCWVNGKQTVISDSKSIVYDPLVDIEYVNDATKIKLKDPKKYTTEANNPDYCVARIMYGDTAGYRTTDLTYAGELIAQVGESLTSVLDKIVSMLGDFEYFYDVEGQFIFQKKKTYVNTQPSPIVNNGTDGKYVDNLATNSALSYTFTNSNLISSFSNSPAFGNVRNDYSVWGTRKGVSGADLKVHMRYAIDEKPTYYQSFDHCIYTTSAEVIANAHQKVITPFIQDNPDWWLMSDWLQYYKLLTGSYPVGTINQYTKGGSWSGNLNSYFPPGTIWNENQQINVFDVNFDGTLGYTGHGTSCTHSYSYFIQLEEQGTSFSYIYNPIIPDSYNTSNHGIVDWREIIYQMALDYRRYNHGDIKVPLIDPLTNQPQKDANGNIVYDPEYTDLDYETALMRNNPGIYPEGITGYEQYYIDLEGFWRQIYNLQPDEKERENFYCDVDVKEHPEYADRLGFSKTVYENPTALNFWFDFLEDNSLNSISNHAIGNRPKAVNESNVKSIYYRETPLIIFATPEQLADKSYERKSGYRYFQVKDIDSMFSISSQGIAAKDKIDNLIYQYSYCTESVTINTVPIYYLQPNTRISVFDENSGINGEYILSKLSIPLTYNGTMSLTATKAPDAIDGRQEMV